MATSVIIDVSDVRIGMHIQLDVGWLHHPFPMNHFRVNSQAQIEMLRSLGLKTVQHLPPGSSQEDTHAISAKPQARLAAERPYHQAWLDCDTRFAQATDVFQQLMGEVQQMPAEARRIAEALVDQTIEDLLPSGDTVIRLLSEGMGQQQASHAINVTILSLLLGKVWGLDAQQLHHLGMAALLHDIGKLNLPLAAQQAVTQMAPELRALYDSHVGASVALCQAMDLPPDVLLPIAQHHELMDGSGFPLRLMQEDLGTLGQILGLVNCYDRLCNPATDNLALTPHEALSHMFAQRCQHFDIRLIKAFVRVMGVYPPGSVIQLSDGRYGMVMSVNSARPLKPQLLVCDENGPSATDGAVWLDLECCPGLAVKRSLRPSQLPWQALAYLSPRQRICYFFERAVDVVAQKVR